jgi:GT2 family glycosyltransferase
VTGSIHTLPAARPDDLALASVAVVIVTYNSGDVLPGCLRSLHSQGVRLAGVVVADNASRDDSVKIAEEYRSLPVRTVQLGRNAGYAAAVNAGIAALNTTDLEAVLVLNPDCRLRPNALATLAQALRHPGRGITVPRLLNTDGSLQPSLRREATVWRAIAEVLIGGRLAGRIGTLGELVTDPAEYERPRAAAWATGAAMLVSVEAMREIGPWDESFFLYSEETEFALRAADRGWTLWYEPKAEVEHIGGDMNTNLVLASLVIVNKVRLFRMRHHALTSAAYFLVMLLGRSLRALMGQRTSRAAAAALIRPSRLRQTVSALMRPGEE